METQTFLEPILDRITSAVHLVVKERAYDYLDLLQEFEIFIILDYKTRSRFSADPLQKKVFLGIDGLEWSWAYSYLFVGQWAGVVEDGPYKLSGQSGSALNHDMSRSFVWAMENDVETLGTVYPADLPHPKADIFNTGTQLEKLHVGSYLTAVAWITLHEIAHIVLKHSTSSTDTLEAQCKDELAADEWAANWMLSSVPEGDLRTNFLRGIVLGVGLAAHLEMWTEADGPRDHPIYPKRLTAFLDKFAPYDSGKVANALWIAGAALILQRAALANKEKVFKGYSAINAPREFILRACDLYPEG